MREIFPENEDLIDLLAELPAMLSLRTLVKARCWQKSRHLNLVEELLAEWGVPGPVTQLVQITETVPEQEWCDQYVAATGLTERTYRWHKQRARQLVECRKSYKACPNVRAAGSGEPYGPAGAVT